MWLLNEHLIPLAHITLTHAPSLSLSLTHTHTHTQRDAMINGNVPGMRLNKQLAAAAPASNGTPRPPSAPPTAGATAAATPRVPHSAAVAPKKQEAQVHKHKTQVSFFFFFFCLLHW